MLFGILLPTNTAIKISSIPNLIEYLLDYTKGTFINKELMLFNISIIYWY